MTERTPTVCADGFDQAFIDWWVNDWCFPPNMGEATPHDDLASFKAMLAERGFAVVHIGSYPEEAGR